MIVVYDDPNMPKRYETEVPCEADPTSFALDLIRQAVREDERLHPALAEDDGYVRGRLKWATADGSPL